MKSLKISDTARIVSIISFILGTGVFALYYFTDAFQLLLLGGYFIIIAGIINLIYLILVIRQILITKGRTKSLYFTSAIILLNIPIALIYCWVTSILLDTMRITFINKTSSVLTDIKIFGCELKHIDKLEPNKKKLVWVAITGDCSVNIEFKKDGKLENQNVSAYVSRGMGKRMIYKIGWENGQANY